MSTKDLAAQLAATTSINVNEFTELAKTVFAETKKQQLSLSAIFGYLCKEGLKSESLAPYIGKAKSEERKLLWSWFKSLLPQAELVDGRTIFCDFVPYRNTKSEPLANIIKSWQIPHLGEGNDLGAEVKDYIDRKVEVVVTKTVTDKETGDTYEVPVKGADGKLVKKVVTRQFMVREKSIWGYTDAVEYAFVTALLKIAG